MKLTEMLKKHIKSITLKPKTKTFKIQELWTFVKNNSLNNNNNINIKNNNINVIIKIIYTKGSTFLILNMKKIYIMYLV